MEVLGFVTYGATKLRNLRARPQVALTAAPRPGRGRPSREPPSSSGPTHPRDGVDAGRLRVLLRDIFTAAGGTHDDWNAYDAEMVAERRTAVLVTPTRIYSN